MKRTLPALFILSCVFIFSARTAFGDCEYTDPPFPDCANANMSADSTSIHVGQSINIHADFYFSYYCFAYGIFGPDENTPVSDTNYSCGYGGADYTFTPSSPGSYTFYARALGSYTFYDPPTTTRGIAFPQSR